MAEEAVLTEADGGVLLITLNRPDARNAVNAALAAGVAAALDRLDADDDLQVGDPHRRRQGVLRRHGPEGVRPGREPARRGPRLRGHRPGPAAQADHRRDRGLRRRRRARGRARLRPDRRRARRQARDPRGQALARRRRRRAAAAAAADPLPPGDGDGAHRRPDQRRARRPRSASSTGWPSRARRSPSPASSPRRSPPTARSRSRPPSASSSRRQGDWSEDEAWQRQGEIAGPVFGSEDAREGATAFAEKRAPVWKGR